MRMPTYVDAQFVRAQVERLILLYPEIADDVWLLGDTLEGETGLHELLTRLVREERQAAAMGEAVNLQMKALTGRRTRFAKQQDAARSLITSLMDVAQQTTIRLPEATLSISAGRPTCRITDGEALPDEFLKIECSPKKAEITKALQEGRHVPGAVLSNGSSHLTVRV